MNYDIITQHETHHAKSTRSAISHIKKALITADYGTVRVWMTETIYVQAMFEDVVEARQALEALLDPETLELYAGQDE